MQDPISWFFCWCDYVRFFRFAACLSWWCVIMNKLLLIFLLTVLTGNICQRYTSEWSIHIFYPLNVDNNVCLVKVRYRTKHMPTPAPGVAAEQDAAGTSLLGYLPETSIRISGESVEMWCWVFWRCSMRDAVMLITASRGNVLQDCVLLLLGSHVVATAQPLAKWG